MNRFSKYLRVWLKRSLKMLPILLCFTLLISGSMLLLLKGLLQNESSSEKNIRMNIGLVGDIEGTYLGLGVTAVKEFDSSRFYVDFQPYQKDEAEKALENGDLIGYVYVPEGFVGEVITGGNPKLSYISSDSPDAIGPLLTREIINIVSSLVLESRYGVYGMGDLASENGLKKKDIRKAEEDLNLLYFDAILTREEAYELNILGTGKGLSFADYYSVAFIIILLMLWGVICVPLLGTRNTELPCLLYGTGTGCFSQIIAEYIPFLLMISVNTLILTSGAGLVAGDMFIFSGLKGFFYLLPASILITSMQFFLYEISSNVISAVLVQLFATLGLAYISGLIYPMGSLPQSVQTLGAHTPAGICLDYMSEIYSSDPGFSQIIPLILFSICFIALSALVRRVKIGRVSL